MPYVVTQSCCADASCVVACPVNCIHPAPGEPGFAEAEMLYVDANSCVDCGACLTACPVDAIKPHTALADDEQPFVALNAEYYEVFPHPDRTPLALVPKQRRLARNAALRFAVVGSGPAGMYVADELLKHPEITVDVFDRLPTPYGLVRAGVAPDHQATKQVTQLFEAIEGERGFEYLLDVEVGRDLSHDELACHYDGVVYAVGAATDRRLGIPGEELPGSLSATDLVGWYNGQPDKQDLRVPLHHERAVVIGNGNVALDVARILTSDPEDLARTDIAALPWATISNGSLREVVVLGRRGPAEAAFTMPELIGLSGIDGINVVVDTGGQPIEGDDAKVRLLAELAGRPQIEGRRTLVLRFRTTPERILGDEAVTGIEVTRDEPHRGHRVRRRAQGDRLPRRTGHRPSVRRRIRHRSQRPRSRPPRGVRRRLGQARPNGLHRDQQVLRTGDRRADARRRRRGGTARAHSHPRGSGRDARVARRDSDRRDRVAGDRPRGAPPGHAARPPATQARGPRRAAPGGAGDPGASRLQFCSQTEAEARLRCRPPSAAVPTADS